MYFRYLYLKIFFQNASQLCLFVNPQPQVPYHDIIFLRKYRKFGNHATPTQGRHKVSPGRTSASGAATAATAPSSGRRSRCRTRIRPHRKARAGAAPRRPEGGPTCRAGAAARRSPSRNRNNGRNVRSPPRPGHRTSPTHRQRLASHGRADRPGRRGPSSKKAGRPERPYVNHS